MNIESIDGTASASRGFSVPPAALLDSEPASGELRPELLGHGAVHDEAEAGVDADEQLRAVVGDEEPKREEAAVVLPAIAVVAARETLLHIQDESRIQQIAFTCEREGGNLRINGNPISFINYPSELS